MTVLVTGASGLVGSAVVRRLVELGGCDVVAVLHRRPANLPASAHVVRGMEMGVLTDWRPALTGVTAVVHCAARVHVLRDNVEDPLGAFRAVNVEGTLRLARQAFEAGVRRFVFVSSIGVNGAATYDFAYTEDDLPMPHSAYAQSKFEAEQGLRRLAQETGLEVTIVRPPLVYGPEASGNFGALVRAIARGLPLPLGAVTRNRRSFVAVDNLVDLILTCLNHCGAAQQVFLAGDGEDLSTAELVQRMAGAMGRSARLVDVPIRFLQILGTLTGKSSVVQSLCGNLQVDISKAEAVLGWKPPIGVNEGLRRAAVQWRK